MCLSGRDRYDGSDSFFSGLHHDENRRKGKDFLGHQIPVVDLEIDVPIGEAVKFSESLIQAMVYEI
jgi:hypothetical protein